MDCTRRELSLPLPPKQAIPCVCFQIVSQARTAKPIADAAIAYAFPSIHDFGANQTCYVITSAAAIEFCRPCLVHPRPQS